MPILLVAGTLGLSHLSAQAPISIRLEHYRITQGLELQHSGGVPQSYDLIAGKDTLVRAVLVSGSETIRAASCSMVGASTAMTYAAQLRLSGGGLGDVDRRHIASCWIPGSDVHDPDVRSFEVVVTTAARYYRFPLGVGRRFEASDGARLIVVPWVLPPGHPEFLPWNEMLALNVAESLQELNRRFPMPTGVGNFSFTGRGTGALRYTLTPPGAPCDRRAGETTDQAAGRCDAQYRSMSDFLIRLYNGAIARRWPGRDLFDMAWNAVTTPSTGGGQSCWGNQRAFGTGLDPDPNGGSATTAAHELAHCLGQVTPASRNHDGGGHARAWDIAVYPDRPLVDTRTRQMRTGPVSLMNGFVANVFNTYFEAYEWNSVRQGLLARSGLLGREFLHTGLGEDRVPPERNQVGFADGVQPLSSGSNQDTMMFGLLATVDRTGTLSVDFAGRLGPLDTSVASDPEASDYTVVFYDKSGRPVGRHGFTPVFDTPDRHTDRTGISLLTPMPPNAARVAVERSTQPLYGAQCDGLLPVVSVPEVQVSGSGQLTVQWKAATQQGRSLRYNVAFARDEKQEPLLVAAGLSTPEWRTVVAALPGTDNGRFVITASDGCNVATAQTAAVRLSRHAPIVRVRLNEPDISESDDTFTLNAVAWDYTDGILGGAALSWYVDDRPVATGDTLVLPVSARGARVKLAVRNSSGQQNVVEQTIP
jgi:hypothetical protein